MFSTPTYVTIGDEYDKKTHRDGKDHGAQFKVGSTKKGNLPDANFDKKFKSLSEGDKYLDPGTFEKRDRMENRKKMITTDGFKYAHASAKSSGLGNNFGCFSSYKHETEFLVVKKGELPSKVNPAPRNLVTSPPKKGTYGTPGVTLGKGDEYRYISDPYERPKFEKDEKEKKGVGPAFKSASYKGECFDALPSGVSKIYSLDRPLPARRPLESPPKQPTPVPFKPSSPPKRGLNGTISKPPEYREDPFELKERKAREEREKNKPAVTWKPVSGTRTLPTRSIAFSATV